MPTCDRWKSVKDGRGKSGQSDRRRQIEALRRVLTQVNNSWRSKQARLTSPAWQRPRGTGNESPGKNRIPPRGNAKFVLINAMPCQPQVIRLFKLQQLRSRGDARLARWHVSLGTGPYVCARPPYVRALVHRRTFRRGTESCPGGGG